MGKRIDLTPERRSQGRSDEDTEADPGQEAVEDLQTWSHSAQQSSVGEVAQRWWTGLRGFLGGNLGAVAALAVIALQAVVIAVVLRTPASQPQPVIAKPPPRDIEKRDHQNRQVAEQEPLLPSRPNPFAPLKSKATAAAESPEGEEVVGIPGAVLGVSDELPSPVPAAPPADETKSPALRAPSPMAERLKRQIHLKGTIRYGEKALAVLQNGSRTVRLQEGESLPGFDARLMKVGRREVVLELQEGETKTSIHLQAGQ